MTEAEYLQAHTVLANEVENALESLYIYKEIDEFASEYPLALRRMNRHPEFWTAIRHALQTTFIITLGRVFDTNDGTHSIYHLVAETVRHPEYFSRNALEARKRDIGLSPEDLSDYMRDAFEPDAAALRKLRKALKPAASKYEEHFKPIRNKMFAHREMLDRSAIQNLISRGLMTDLEEILHSVHDILACIFQLFYNGTEPKLGVREYDHKRRAREATRGALKRLLDVSV